MANAKIIEGHNNLNAIGCSFFLNSNEKICTRITSSNLRWLSIRENNDCYLSVEQEKACNRIDTILDTYRTAEWDKLNMKILLFSNPTKSKDNHYIKKLILCGADIRYLPLSTRQRMVLQGNKLYFSISSNRDKVVNIGWIYEGRPSNDPFIDFYKDWFDKKFEKAKIIGIKKDKLVTTDSVIKKIYVGFSNLTLENWINLLLGAVLGTLTSLLFTNLL